MTPWQWMNAWLRLCEDSREIAIERFFAIPKTDRTTADRRRMLAAIGRYDDACDACDDACIRWRS